ncbi:ABC transporter substrate-binding protein [Variovorax sp. M-6]|uniref:ABC transporter substrate-binding protein n=1 Tax=Variovorax sp. M-6 TaxID=3233041 RepID=UPI003F9D03C3
MSLNSILKSILLCGAIAAALAAQAEVTVGVILSSTGQAASLGILEKNGVALAAAGAKEKFKLIYVDDATDPSEAARVAKKLITEEKVDAIIGTTGTPGALAISGVAAEGRTPVISQAPANILVQPVDAQRRWIYKTTTNDDHEANPIFAHMKANGVRSLGFVGFSDSYGDQWLRMVKQLGAEQQIQLVAEERFARTDTTVASQVLKIVSKSPDAVLIAGSGGAAATPLLELRKRGYKGKVYVTLGATFGDFLRLAGPEAEGLYAPFAAVMGVSQLPDSDPAKRSAQEFVQAYDAKFGANSGNIFSAGGWDAVKLLDQAVPVALKSAAPGTPEFREALRTALENVKNMPGARGIYSLSTTDHAGLDSRALRVGRFEKGRWVLQD